MLTLCGLIVICSIFVIGSTAFQDDFPIIAYFQPEQVHLSLGPVDNSMTVTWSTFNETGESIVEYGIDKMDLAQKSPNATTEFIDGGLNKRKQYIHRVTLTGLKPKTKYVYHCGSDLGWSDEFWFYTVDPSPSYVAKLAVYGDMGNVNAQSLPRLQKETQDHEYDAILHVGDFAYDMHWDDGRVGDQFMNQIQPIAAYLPYMVCVGNHEGAYNFSHYRSRFSMPNSNDNLYYSFTIGPVRFIAISTEVYYFLNYGMKQVVTQYEWFDKELAKAASPENRKTHPWIVVFGHRPMYCSNNDDDDCTQSWALTRTGFFGAFAIEPLLYKYGVDVAIWAHEHSYERLWPVYNFTVHNGSTEHPYVNPKAPVHIVTGSAGCRERVDNFIDNNAWSAFRNSDYGYTVMHLLNETHLRFQQKSDDKNGVFVDDFYVVKDKHESFLK
uniref:Purple acid phosphatase n=1 Tax=Cacopsylla melanoneura TaxID=428564 RepID=A0A8D9EJ63_9HEMI